MATAKQAKELVSQKKSPLQKIEDVLIKSAKSLGQTLPAHMKPERLNRIVLTQLRTIPKLQECTPISVTAAVFQMAQLGLEPIDGQAYILPYNNKKKIGDKWTTVKEAQFQIGYKGLVALFYRHQSSLSLTWGIICENDSFTFDKGQNILSHKYSLKEPRGEAYAYWVKARLLNGAEIFEVMSKVEVLQHAREHSKAYDKKAGTFYANTPWLTDFDSMALKTVLIRLMKLLPKSVEIQKAIAMDETTKSQVDIDMADVPDETNWENGNGKTLDVEAQINGEQPEEAPKKPEDFKTDSNGRAIDPETKKPI